VAPRYTVEAEIGRGGMAVVFGGRDTADGRALAFKALKRQYATVLGPTRFLREIRLLAQLRHPGILPLLDSGQRESLYYFVMPLVVGETLEARRRSRGPSLPLRPLRPSAPGAGDGSPRAGPRPRPARWRAPVTRV
jgi:serine/threonine protein kinase